MPIPDLPTPDDLLTRLMVWFFGPGTAAVSIFVFCLWLRNWKGAIVRSLDYGRRAGEFAQHALSLRPVALMFALLVSTLMPVIQAIWLWTCYVAGNAWSYMLHPPKEIPESGPEWDLIFTSLQFDSLSKTYLGICLLALIVSYITAIRRSESPLLGVVGFILIAPTALIGVMALILCLLNLLLSLLYLISDGYFELSATGKGALLLFGFAVMHIVTCLIALATPQMMSEAWGRNARPPVGARV